MIDRDYLGNTRGRPAAAFFLGGGPAFLPGARGGGGRPAFLPGARGGGSKRCATVEDMKSTLVVKVKI